jgi:hypothetical protein
VKGGDPAMKKGKKHEKMEGKKYEKMEMMKKGKGK